MNLADHVPETGFPSADAALDAFLTWVGTKGLTLYPHQEEALLEVFAGKHVVLDAPTGSGKSLVATALHFKTFAFVGKAWYTAPIKALVSEKFFELCKLFGPEYVGLVTGDGAVNADAPIVCATAEILADLALREGDTAKVTSVAMDEFHYYGDRDRGGAWQVPLLALPNTQFLLMSGTLGDTRALREDLEKRTGRPVAEITGAHRPVPLEYSWSMTPLQEQLQQLVRENKAPVYAVHFTQANATETAQALTSVDWCTKEEKKALAEATKGVSFTSPFGPTLRRFVHHGIGLHHAGLLPRYRLLVERLAQQGLLRIICGTDTLGVGINVPIRTVLFTRLCKFDGENVVILPVREFRQIAGRAGRAGFDTKGWVVVQAPEHVIENAKVRVTDPKRAKKAVKAQPPTFGYKHWDENTFQGLVSKPPETLTPRLAMDHGKVLSAMKHAEAVDGDARKGLERVLALVRKSHVTARERAELEARATDAAAHLAAAGLLTDTDGRLHLDPSLPEDFSLHHALAMFLVVALGTVDPASPTHTLDVVSWVEAILENPRVVLQAQVSREKGRLVAELKAAGVPFEERQEQLEEVSWPKPGAERIYAVWNEYRASHPWVEAEAIRPKAVARELVETFASFSGFVKDLRIERAEGVLLRYLHDVWRILDRSLPPEHRTDPVLDATAALRAMLARVDGSLLHEWETLLRGGERVAEVVKVDISEDRRAFAARLRAELHAVVRALAQADWEEAAASLHREAPPTPGELERALGPFLEEHGRLAFDHRARQATNTVIRQLAPHRWEVAQRLWWPSRGTTESYRVEGWSDEAEDTTWTLTGTVDLREDTDPDGPLVRYTGFSG